MSRPGDALTSGRNSLQDRCTILGVNDGRLLPTRTRVVGTSLLVALGMAVSACGAGTDQVAVGSGKGAADSAAANAPESVPRTAASSDTVQPIPDSVSDEVSPLLNGEFTALSGESVNLASFRGQDVVFWFWAPW